MKDNINRLARGEFRYELPKISVEDTLIEQTIQLDETYHGTIKLTGSSSEVKGVVYSDQYRVQLQDNSFTGVDSVLFYTVDAARMTVGDVIAGKFEVVSNAGEFTIKYRFKIREKTVKSSMGEIHNLFHFANLVQVSPAEAQKLFVSEQFEDIFLKDDLELSNIYRTLISGNNVQNSIEEFLIAIHKKMPISIRFALESDKKGSALTEADDKQKKALYSFRKYEKLTEDYSDTLVIQKNTWGYAKIEAHADADFVELSAERIHTDAFAGNQFELHYVIHYEKMHAGRNFARIVVQSAREQLVCEIEAYQDVEFDAKHSVAKAASLEKRKAIMGLTKAYIDFRTQRMERNVWAEKSGKILSRVCAILPNETAFQLAQAQIYCAQGRTEDAGWILEQVREDVLEEAESHTENLLYCYYLYVNSLLQKNDSYTASVSHILHKHYEYGSGNWKLLWLLFYVDDEYDRNESIKLVRIKELFHRGCRSPILYLEACNIFNSQPVLLRVFDEFELQVIHFGCRYGMLNEKAAGHICEIGQNEKTVSKTYLRILEMLYQEYMDDEMLSVLCKHLIRNHYTGEKCFKIYEAGIIRGLRITRLYESYMDSLDMGYTGMLPQMVRLYFSYNNQLNTAQKAYLYANIIRNKQKDSETYNTYAKQMELFAIEQLREGNISDEHAILYQELWDDALIHTATAKSVARILFAYKLTCMDEQVRFVIVKHKEIQKEEVVPVINHVAYVVLYTENCSIAFEDADHERKMDTAAYDLVKLFEHSELVQKVYNLIPEDLYLSIYYYERNRKYQLNSIDSVSLREHLLMAENLTESFREEIIDSLVEYYYGQYNGDEFRSKFYALLEQKEAGSFSKQQSAKLIAACVTNGMYEDAYDLAVIYGVELVQPNRIFRLCRHMLEIMGEEDHEELIQLCAYAFQNHKYDDTLLEYLNRYFNGTTYQMVSIWESCNNFNVDCYELEERIVAQMLFLNERTELAAEIFAQYYAKGAKERVTEAYLMLHAYSCFVRQENADPQIFEIIAARLTYQDEVSDLCKLALLHAYSEAEELSEAQLRLANSILREMCNKDILFQFYRKFARKFTLPFKIVDKTVIEYRTNPFHKVVIRYAFQKDVSPEHYRSDTLDNTFEGIFTKAFTLFYGDTIYYYIVESSNGEEKVSEVFCYTCRDINLSATHGRYEYLNDMLASKEQHDMVTLEKLMHGYCVQDYVTKQLFQLK